MLHWTKLVHVGDIALTLAAAAAMTVWLLTVRARRMAFWWSLLFSLGVALVAATKIAFLAWGIALPGLHFNAISGHATGVTAVLPTLLYLLLRRRGAHTRSAGVGAGLALGALMGVLLVTHGEHSVAEAVAGWMVGAMISLGSIWMAGAPPPRGTPLGLACAALVFISSAVLMRSVPFGYLVSGAAAFLSRNTAPFPWIAGC